MKSSSIWINFNIFIFIPEILGESLHFAVITQKFVSIDCAMSDMSNNKAPDFSNNLYFYICYFIFWALCFDTVTLTVF